MNGNLPGRKWWKFSKAHKSLGKAWVISENGDQLCMGQE